MPKHSQGREGQSKVADSELAACRALVVPPRSPSQKMDKRREQEADLSRLAAMFGIGHVCRGTETDLSRALESEVLTFSSRSSRECRGTGGVWQGIRTFLLLISALGAAFSLVLTAPRFSVMHRARPLGRWPTAFIPEGTHKHRLWNHDATHLLSSKCGRSNPVEGPALPSPLGVGLWEVHRISHRDLGESRVHALPAAVAHRFPRWFFLLCDLNCPLMLPL